MDICTQRFDKFVTLISTLKSKLPNCKKSVLLPVDFIISMIWKKRRRDAYANFSIPEFLMHRAEDKKMSLKIF